MQANGNVSFGVHFLMPNGTKLPLLPLRDYAADECSNGKHVKGELAAPMPGTLVATWEHPGWWSRELFYRFYKLDETTPA